jgi:hypothetical protein
MFNDYFEPIFFYHLAKELEKCETLNSDFSAIERTIVDRIYYSVYLEYRDYLEKNYNFFPGDNVHERLGKFIIDNNIFNENSLTVFNKIKKLRTYRNKASYEIVVSQIDSEKMSFQDIFNDSEFLFNQINVKF